MIRGNKWSVYISQQNPENEFDAVNTELVVGADNKTIVNSLLSPWSCTNSSNCCLESRQFLGSLPLLPNPGRCHKATAQTESEIVMSGSGVTPWTATYIWPVRGGNRKLDCLSLTRSPCKPCCFGYSSWWCSNPRNCLWFHSFALDAVEGRPGLT